MPTVSRATKERDEYRRQAEQQAAVWLERLERTLKAEESAALKEWLKVRLHREVIVHKCKIWHGPEILGVLGQLIPIEDSTNRWSKFGVVAINLAICGLGLAALVSATWHQPGKLATLRVEETYEAPVGSTRAIILPDGSNLALNSASRVLISYDPNYRDVILIKGEATFNVAKEKDLSRSFRVYVGSRRFDAGTEKETYFNIRRLARENAELLVMQGTVRALESKKRTPLTPEQVRLNVSTGDHTFKSSEAGLLGAGWYSAWTLDATVVTQRLAWHNGRIILVDRTLEDALSEIERYTTARFVFANDDLRKIHISAELNIGDLGSVLHFLRDSLQIDSRLDADQRYVLSPVARQEAAPIASGTKL